MSMVWLVGSNLLFRWLGLNDYSPSFDHLPFVDLTLEWKSTTSMLGEEDSLIRFATITHQPNLWRRLTHLFWDDHPPTQFVKKTHSFVLQWSPIYELGNENSFIGFVANTHSPAWWWKHTRIWASHEWLIIHWVANREGGCLVWWRLRDRFPAEAAPIFNVQLAFKGYCPVKGGGVTVCQLNLSSLTPLFIAGCGRLQIAVAQLATEIALLQGVDNWPHKQW